MAVLSNATDVDRALDRAARVFSEDSHVALDRASSALLILSTWRSVARRALEVGDLKLATIANQQREHWQRVYESLSGGSSPPAS